MGGSPWPLLGRDTELARLADAIDDPTCGGVVLIGPAGVGKTRLATYTIEMATARGLATSAIRATRSGSGIPFAALAPLLPEIDLPTEASTALFRDAGDAIDARRGDTRFMLMVDDAQELDDASVALLDHLVGIGCVFVVLTVRRDEGGPPIAGSWLDERIHRIDLGPLAESEIRALATIGAGGPIEGSTMQTLLTASAGNPLFLRELVDGGLESGALVNQFGLWRLEGALLGSPRLQDQVGLRVQGLPDDQREALELVALGDPLELGLLSALVPGDAVEQLEARGVLDATSGRMGLEVRLAHPLYGEAVRARLSPVRRARLCRLLADAVEQQGSKRPRDLLRVAVWRLDGGGGGRPDTSLEAARAAMRSGDYGLASRLAGYARDNGGGAEAAYVLGESLDFEGRPTEAEEVLADAWAEATDDQLRTNMAVRRASNLFRALGRAEEADRVVLDALDLVNDKSCRRQLEALRADHLLLSGQVTKALALTEPLLAEPGDAAFAQASLDTGTALALAGRTAEAIRHTEEGLATRIHLDEETHLSDVGVYVVAQCVALGEAGRLDEAGALAEIGYQQSVERSIPGGQAWFASVLGGVRMSEGRLATAARYFGEVATRFGSLGHPGQRWGLGGLALAAGQMGDRQAGLAALAELDAVAPTPVQLMDVELHRGRAWVSVSVGDLVSARAELWRGVEMADERGQYALGAAAAHDLVRLGEGRRAVERLRDLAERVDGDLMAARVRYGLAVLSDDPDLAAAAADAFEAMGARLYAAEAAALEQQRSTEAGLARRASAAAARCARLVERCESPRTPALVVELEIDALSSREREIALLAAEGRTSREIAERLYLSVRTVDNHLQRAYTKLGVGGRSELAAALGRA
jgi:DNA-binding CsgD family transcriptional regulator